MYGVPNLCIYATLRIRIVMMVSTCIPVIACNTTRHYVPALRRPSPHPLHAKVGTQRVTLLAPRVGQENNEAEYKTQ